MKSSKGKGPANGVTKTPKKLQQVPSGRQKLRDPVEVAFLKLLSLVIGVVRPLRLVIGF